MRFRVVPGALLFVLGLLGCEPTPLSKTQTQPPTSQPATVHFVQGAFALPKVDLLIESKKQGVSTKASLDYRQAKGGISLPAGDDYQLSLSTAGSTMPIYTSGLVVQEGQRLLLLARWGEDKGAKKVMVQAEPLGVVDDTGVKLRLLHAAEGAPTLDLIGSDKKPLIEAVAEGAASSYAALKGDLAAMTALALREHGQTDNLWSVLVPATVAKGSVFTAIAIGDPNPLASDEARFRVAILDEAKGTLTDLPTEPSTEGAKGSVSFLNVATDPPPIDVLLPSGTKLAANLGYQRASMVSELAGGTYELTVKESASGTELTTMGSRPKLRLLPGQRVLLAVHGPVPMMAGSVGLLALPRGGQGGAWRVAHLVPGTPAFDVKLTGRTVAQGLPYPSAMSPQHEDLPSGLYQFVTKDSRVPGWQTTVDAATAMQVANESVTIVVAGALNNGLKPPSALLIVESQATTMAPPPVRLLPTSVVMMIAR